MYLLSMHKMTKISTSSLLCFTYFSFAITSLLYILAYLTKINVPVLSKSVCFFVIYTITNYITTSLIVFICDQQETKIKDLTYSRFEIAYNDILAITFAFEKTKKHCSFIFTTSIICNVLFAKSDEDINKYLYYFVILIHTIKYFYRFLFALNKCDNSIDYVFDKQYNCTIIYVKPYCDKQGLTNMNICMLNFSLTLVVVLCLYVLGIHHMKWFVLYQMFFVYYLFVILITKNCSKGGLLLFIVIFMVGTMMSILVTNCVYVSLI